MTTASMTPWLGQWATDAVEIRFVPLTDNSVDEMLRDARVAALTGRTAALGRHGQWPVWAVLAWVCGTEWAECCDRSNGCNEPSLTDAARLTN